MMRHFPLLFLFCAALPACGFSPVYGKKEAGSQEANLRGALDATRFEAVDTTRAGQLLSIAIEDALHPTGNSGSRPQYRLRMEPPSVEEIPISVENSQFVARTNLRLNARFHLVRLSDNRELLAVTLRRISSFNTSTTSDFSTVVARDDAIKRGATALGSDTAMRVQAALASELAHPASDAPHLPVTIPAAQPTLPPVPWH